MKVKAEYVPDNISYIKVNKAYEVLHGWSDRDLFTIVDEEGVKIDILISGCAHLDGHKWTIVEENE